MIAAVPERAGRILVVGDVMVDVIVRPDGPIVPGSDRRASIASHNGGSGANQAVWLGAMGADVAFAGRVGAGDVARYREFFRERGVVPLLAGDADRPTGTLVTLLDPQGERSFLTDRGANLGLCAADLPDGLLDGVGLVMVSGYSFFEPGPRAAVRNFTRRARDRKVLVAIDAASTGFIDEVGVGAFLDWTHEADLLFANEAEAELLGRTTDAHLQMKTLGELYQTVVLKRGAGGAALGDKHGIALSLTAPSVDAIDTTGAGDAFAAGFLARYFAGAGLEGALQAGIDAGAGAVQQVGGQPVRI